MVGNEPYTCPYCQQTMFLEVQCDCLIYKTNWLSVKQLRERLNKQINNATGGVLVKIFRLLNKGQTVSIRYLKQGLWFSVEKTL